MYERFIEIFGVPPEARTVIGAVFRPEEIGFVERLPGSPFTEEEAAKALGEVSGRAREAGEVRAFLRESYKRGIVALGDDSFTRFVLGSFYTRLDIFVITERQAYRAFPRAVREALDGWYFDRYLAGLGGEDRPTSDRVLTLPQALARIDAETRTPYLSDCDCRLLAGRCGRPTRTCLSFYSGINSMAHRGWSQPLTREEAKDVVRRANRAGLMQTANDNSMCNCCGDCCYLFRAQRARGRGVVWPAAGSIAAYDPAACVSCRLCVKRCPFGAFEEEGGIRFRPERCRGCGLCAETCPAGAIAMQARETGRGEDPTAREIPKIQSKGPVSDEL